MRDTEVEEIVLVIIDEESGRFKQLMKFKMVRVEEKIPVTNEE